MRLSVITCAVSGLLISALPGAAAATVAIGGTVNAGALAQANGGPLDAQTATDVAAGLPGMLTAAVSVSSTAQGNGTVAARTMSRATWATADAGTVELALSRTFSTLPGLGGVQNNGSANPNWSYQFNATSNGFFNLNYDVSFLGGSAFGFNGWNLDVNGVTALPLQNIIDPTASGSFSYALTAGTGYTFTLNNNSNISGGVSDDYSGSVLGQFNWTIVGGNVPEPATWGLMIVGFGMAGVALRRRRGLAAPPFPLKRSD